MRDGKMLLRALGVERAVVENVRWCGAESEAPELVVEVRPVAKEGGRCPHCHRRCGRYDAGDGVRRWRANDFGLVRMFVEAAAPRVHCPEHGVVVQHVPWARHGAGFTRAFEDTVAWLAVRTDKTTLSTLMGVAWRTVGAIVTRVSKAALAASDPFTDVTRIGIDEVSYRKGHRYLTVVVDHDSGRLLWASPGRDEATLQKFFALLGAERAAKITLISADAATWIPNVVRERCPNAVLCMDPFHVVQWATRALDEVRRRVWNDLRKSGRTEDAQSLKGSRWALWKNPEDLTFRQEVRLSIIEQNNRPLYRGYLLKEHLRDVFKTRGKEGKQKLDVWLAWASRSKLVPFVKVAKAIRSHRVAIDNVLEHGLTNARIESANTKLRLLTRLAFGFHSHAPLIALAMLKLGGLCPPLPGRG